MSGMSHRCELSGWHSFSKSAFLKETQNFTVFAAIFPLLRCARGPCLIMFAHLGFPGVDSVPLSCSLY